MANLPYHSAAKLSCGKVAVYFMKSPLFVKLISSFTVTNVGSPAAHPSLQLFPANQYNASKPFVQPRSAGSSRGASGSQAELPIASHSCSIPVF